MRTILALTLLLGAVSCLSPTPRTELPAPYERNGVRVSIQGFYKQGISVVGLTGTAENVSGKDLSVCSLSFDVVDADGVKVGDAIATTQGLTAGQKWRFQAVFTTPFRTTFKAIRPGKVTVF